MTSPVTTADPGRIMQHVRHLASEIGPRLAGSPEEQAAADYIESQMRALGLADVEQQPFTCKWYDIRQASLQVRDGHTWEPVTMDAVAHSPSTPGEIEAELVYVGTAGDDVLDRVDLKDRVALVHGTYGPSPRMIRRFAEAQVAAVIWTDVRYTTQWNVLVGLPYTFLQLFTCPASSVPYTVQWDLVRRGVDRVKLNLDLIVADRLSQNVVGVLPGASADGGVIVCGHHDSVRGCTGAEDNAAGVGCALAVAAALRDMKLAKPVKIASFGTEEQLSQGAFAFVDTPANRAAKLDLVLNIDGMGCWTGVNDVFLTGSAGLHEYMHGRMAAYDWPGRVRDEPDGFSDHFPFIVKGVPGAWFHRGNCPGGRWFHHSQYDTTDVLSPQVLADCASFVLRVAHDIASQPTLPFARRFPARTRRAVAAVADGWLNV